jgi:hypothetical protein
MVIIGKGRKGPPKRGLSQEQDIDHRLATAGGRTNYDPLVIMVLRSHED